MTRPPEDEEDRWLPLKHGEVPEAGEAEARKNVQQKPEPKPPAAAPAGSGALPSLNDPKQLHAVLERKRRRIAGESSGTFALRILGFGGIVFLLGLVGHAYFGVSLAYPLTVAAVTALIAFYGPQWNASPTQAEFQAYGVQYTTQYVPAFFRKRLVSYTYHPGRGFEPETLADYLGTDGTVIQDFRSKDLLTGSYPEYTVRSAYVVGREMEVLPLSAAAGTTVRHLKDTWTGRLIEVTFPARRFRTRLELAAGRELPGLEDVSVDDAVFLSAFPVQSTDPALAAELLTPELRRAFLDLDDVHRRGVSVSLRKNAWFFFFSHAGPLRAPLHKSLSEAKNLDVILREKMTLRRVLTLLRDNDAAWEP